MKVVILCGGEGMRLREKTEEIPKPLVEIGGRPILWHIMKYYSCFGFTDFILCLGYKGEKIKEYFLEYKSWKYCDFKLQFGQEDKKIEEKRTDMENWSIIFAETGRETKTGGRIKKIEKYIEEPVFTVTYGDGLAAIDLDDLIRYHKNHRKMATITCANARCQFGIVEMDSNNVVISYRQKPLLNRWVNGGFFVFDKKIFSNITENDELEGDVLVRLVRQKQICGYKLEKFWDCMDTYKDTQNLNELWKTGKAPWKIWKDA